MPATCSTMLSPSAVHVSTRKVKCVRVFIAIAPFPNPLPPRASPPAPPDSSSSASLASDASLRRTDHVLSEASDQMLRGRIPVGLQDPGVSFEMLEHAVFSAALEQQRLHRDGRQIGHNFGKFLWDAPGIGDVGHNETCHASQQ